MPVERALPKEQSWFLDVAAEIVGKALYDKEGMCFGYSQLGDQAILSRNLDAFKERLQWVRYGPPKQDDPDKLIKPGQSKELAKIVKQHLLDHPNRFVHRELRNKLDKAIEWIYSGTPKGYDETIKPEQLADLIEIAQAIRAHYSEEFRNSYYSKLAVAPLTLAQIKKQIKAAERERASYYKIIRSEIKSTDKKIIDAEMASKLKLFDDTHTEIRDWIDIKIKADVHVGNELAVFDRENPNIRSLIDIKIFFENMAIYQAPIHDSFAVLYEEGSRPTHQAAKPLYPLLAPIELDIAAGKKTTTRMVEIADFEGFYTFDKLQAYFQTLGELLLTNMEIIKNELEAGGKEAIELPFALSIGSFNHRASASFNAKTNKWIVIDTNSPSPYEVEMKDIAAVVAQIYVSNPHLTSPNVVLNTQIIIDSEAKSLVKVLESWQQNKTFSAIHEIQAVTENQSEAVDDVYGASQLHIAVKRNHIDSVKQLLAAGADPDLPASDNITTPFRWATPEIAAYMWPYRINILENKLNLFATNTIDPIQAEAIANRLKLVSQAVSSKNNEEKYAALNVELEQLKEVEPVVKKLLEQAAHLTLADPAKIAINSIIKEAYLKDGSKVTTLNEAYFTAIKKGDLATVEIYLKAGIQPYRDDLGSTALYRAAEYNQIALVTLLLQNGSNLNEYTEGNTLLHVAAGKGHLELVKWVLEHTDYINHTNYEGKSALDLAAEKGHLGIVKLLVANDVSISENAVNVAVKNGHQDIALLLKGKFNTVKRARDETIKLLVEHKEIISQLASTKIPTRNTAITALKALAVGETNLSHAANLALIYKTFKQIDNYAATLLAKPKLATDVVDQAFKTAFTSVLKIQNDNDAKQCLDQLKTDLGQIRDNIAVKHKWALPFFKSKKQVQLINNVLNNAANREIPSQYAQTIKPGKK